MRPPVLSLILLLALAACQGTGGGTAKEKDKAEMANVTPDMMRQYSKNLQQYVDAMLLCGSTLPADWEEAKRQFNLLHPFFVFKEDLDLIRALKEGNTAARQELARRGVILRSVLVFVSGPYNRAKWDDARKMLMDSGEAGQVLLCTTLLKMLLNGQNQEIWPHVRYTLVESGPIALETTVGLAKEIVASTPADTAIFRMDDLVQLFMVVIAFGDAGRAPLEEFSSSGKPNVRRSAARAIGESKDGSSVQILIRLQQDADWTVRMAATQGMGQMNSVRSTAGPALVARLGKERDGLVFRTVLRAIGDLLYADAIPDLIGVLQLPSRETVESAMQALYIITGEKYLKREEWAEWYRLRYPDWKKRHPSTR
ncbi:MAG: HEAT repeat domain-containing protein [Planctomycetes bacterium]|nr:HEAT repeat domain-containing protein [Planctomycetota bacterium]